MAPAVSSAREPTYDASIAMRTLTDVFAWARLMGDISQSTTPAWSLLMALGADEFTMIDEFAAIPEANFNRTMETIWRHSESRDGGFDGLPTDLVVVPSEVTKARASSAHHAARIWAGIVETRAAKARKLDDTGQREQTYRDAKLVAMQAAASNGSRPTTAPTDPGETVPINEVADTTQKREVPVMSVDDYKVYYKNYKKYAHVDPTPDITPSRPQLSVLKVILGTGTCYVDMALWGNYQNRSARAMRCEGTVPGPGGTQVRADFKGPPDHSAWVTCFTVYSVAMIMLDQVLPPWLIGYMKIIADYDALYGYVIWAFLYQMDVRFRSEHMPYMLIRESDRLEDLMGRIGGYGSTGYDPAKP